MMLADIKILHKLVTIAAGDKCADSKTNSTTMKAKAAFAKVTSSVYPRKLSIKNLSMRSKHK